MSLLHTYTKQELMDLITGKLRRNFGRDVEEATALPVSYTHLDGCR